MRFSALFFWRCSFCRCMTLFVVFRQGVDMFFWGAKTPGNGCRGGVRTAAERTCCFLWQSPPFHADGAMACRMLSMSSENFIRDAWETRWKIGPEIGTGTVTENRGAKHRIFEKIRQKSSLFLKSTCFLAKNTFEIPLISCIIYARYNI